MPGRVRERPVLAPAGHASVDEARVPGEADVGPEPQPLGDPRPEPLDERVGLLDQAQDGLHAVGMLQVDGDVASAARVEHEPARPGRALDELDPLHPHHLGAHVGQQRARERSRPDPGELDDLHPVQWSHGRSFTRRR